MPTKSENNDLPIVKIGWIRHNRAYTIGIQQFLAAAGIEISDEKIKTTIRKLLSKDALHSGE